MVINDNLSNPSHCSSPPQTCEELKINNIQQRIRSPVVNVLSFVVKVDSMKKPPLFSMSPLGAGHPEGVMPGSQKTDAEKAARRDEVEPVLKPSLAVNYNGKVMSDSMIHGPTSCANPLSGKHPGGNRPENHKDVNKAVLKNAAGTQGDPGWKYSSMFSVAESKISNVNGSKLILSLFAEELPFD